MTTLPLSGRVVFLRPLTGSHEAVLLDTRHLDEAEAALALLASVFDSDEPIDWLDVPVHDVDYALLQVHRMVFGKTVRTVAYCQNADCNAPMDIEFDIDDYLEHKRPRPMEGVAEVAEHDWWTDDGSRFRAPNLRDEIEAMRTDDRVATLKQRCIERGSEDKTVEEIEAALDRLAPNLTSELSATCPECGKSVEQSFDPRAYVLTELRDKAMFLDSDAHLIASTYHWSYNEIVSLQSDRRAQFAERIRGDLSGGES